MPEVYQIKKKHAILLIEIANGLFARFTVSAYRNNNMKKTEQCLPKQQQMNKTKLNPPDTQYQLLCIN